MHKSSSEILREYANIIAEGDLGNPYNNTAEDTEDFNYGEEGGPMRDAINQNADDEENGVDLPDESLMEPESKDDSEFLTYDQVPENDPVINLSRDLQVDSDKISRWLSKNKYELTPVGGLSNKEGNI